MSFSNPITREHIQYALGVVAAVHTIFFAHPASVPEFVVRAIFACVLLGIAGVNDFYNSPPVVATVATKLV